MKNLIVLLAVLFLCGSGFGQKKQVNDTIISEVLKKLSEQTVCGNSEKPPTEFFSGSIIKRQFAENELWLNGFVLRKTNDRRVFINLDAEYISGLARSAPEDLSAFLVKGRKIKVSAYRCGRIYYAYKIQPL